MFQTLPYARSRKAVDKPGIPPMYLYGLTTCVHCLTARRLLEEYELPFHMVYLDTLDVEVRRPVMQALRAQYGSRVLYPVLEVDGDFMFGFDRDEWTELLESLEERSRIA